VIFGELIAEIDLPIELINRNDGRGHHFGRTASERKKIEKILRASGHLRAAPMPCAVDLKIIRVLGKGQRVWDADSVLRGNSKELIDSLVALNWFVDDSPKYIKRCVGLQTDSERKIGPLTRLQIYKHEN
jgi:hypothetical protein